MGTAPAVPPLPPGPPEHPLLQSLRFHRDPLGFLGAARREFGPTFTIRLPFTGPAVIVTRPADARRAAGMDPAAAHAGAARRGILGMVSERSVLGADGEAHDQARGSVAAAFSDEALAGKRDLMRSIALRHVASWPRGRPFRLLPRMRAIADEIFVRAVIGIADGARAGEMARLIQRLISSPGNPPLPVPSPGDGLPGTAVDALFRARAKPMVELIGTELDERRSDPAETGLIGLIARALPESAGAGEVADRLLPLTMAGQEPAAAGLTWLADRIARDAPHPAELAGQLSSDPLDHPFAAEALRLRPPVHSIGRRLTRSEQVDGWELPAGTTLLAPMVLLHRDPAAFDRPDLFDPARFNGRREDDRGGAYLPFGGGARRCLGEQLAKAEISTVLPALFEAGRLRPLAPRPERMVVRGTILVPVRSALATFADRRPAPASA